MKLVAVVWVIIAVFVLRAELHTEIKLKSLVPHERDLALNAVDNLELERVFVVFFLLIASINLKPRYLFPSLCFFIGLNALEADIFPFLFIQILVVEVQRKHKRSIFTGVLAYTLNLDVRVPTDFAHLVDFALLVCPQGDDSLGTDKKEHFFWSRGLL